MKIQKSKIEYSAVSSISPRMLGGFGAQDHGLATDVFRSEVIS